jgi:hypothetical protein
MTPEQDAAIYNQAVAFYNRGVGSGMLKGSEWYGYVRQFEREGIAYAEQERAKNLVVLQAQYTAKEQMAKVKPTGDFTYVNPKTQIPTGYEYILGLGNVYNPSIIKAWEKGNPALYKPSGYTPTTSTPQQPQLNLGSSITAYQKVTPTEAAKQAQLEASRKKGRLDLQRAAGSINLPSFDFTKTYGSGSGLVTSQISQPYDISGNLPYQQRGTRITKQPTIKLPTTEELYTKGYVEEAGRREMLSLDIYSQNTLKDASEREAGKISDEIIREAEIRINAGEKLDKVQKWADSEFNKQYSEAMIPYVKEATDKSTAESERISKKMSKAIDRRDYIPILAGGLLTGATYGIVSVVAPPVGIAAGSIFAAQTLTNIPETIEYAKQKPLSFAASLGGSLAGGFSGAKFTGKVKTGYMERQFAKASETAEIKVLGVQKDVGNNFMQQILGETTILGKKYQMKINTIGTDKIAGSKGYVARLSEKGKVEAVTGYQAVTRGKATGEAMAVRPGKMFNLKALIGEGFVSEGAARTTWNIEFKGLKGKGKMYPGAKFEKTPDMAGYSKQIENIIKFGAGKKELVYAYTKTPTGFTYAPSSKVRFTPRITGFLIKAKQPVSREGIGSFIAGKGTKGLKTDLFTKQVSAIPQLLLGSGKQGIKAVVKPQVRMGTITAQTSSISSYQLSRQQNKQQVNVQKALTSGLVSEGRLKLKERQGFAGAGRFMPLQYQRTDNKQIQKQMNKLAQVQLQQPRQTQQQKQYSRQMNKLAQIQKPAYRPPKIPIFTLPIFLRMPTYSQQPQKRKPSEYERQMAKQARAYQSSVGAYELGLYAPKGYKPQKKFAGTELRYMIRDEQPTSKSYTKQLNKLFA